jgi:hypothetical protein
MVHDECVLSSPRVGSTDKWGSRLRHVLRGLLMTTLPSMPVSATTPSSGAEIASDASTQTKILVLLGADDREMRQALEAARTQLAARRIVLEPIEVDDRSTPDRAIARELGGEHAAQGVFWFDRSQPGEVGVFLAADDGSTFVRRVPVAAESSQASLEAVFLIVEHSSTALAAGVGVAMESVEMDTGSQHDEPAPVANPEEARSTQTIADDDSSPARAMAQRRVRFGASVAYRGESFAADMPWQSGAALGVHLDVGRWLRLGLDYSFSAPWRADASPLIWRHGAGLHVGVRTNLTKRLELSGRLVGAVDLVHWATAEATDLRVVAVVGPDVLLRVHLFRGAFFELGPGVGIVLNRFAFIECEATATACEGDARRVALDPWRVRPRFQAGVGYRF